jgi:phage tail protein X
MISPDSRYINNVVTLIDNSEGQAIATIVPNAPANVFFTYTPYQFTGADRIDNLAYQFYGDSDVWWAIANANPEVLDWSNVTPGTILRIPDIQ